MLKDDRLFYIDRVKDEHGDSVGAALHAEVQAYRVAALHGDARGS